VARNIDGREATEVISTSYPSSSRLDSGIKTQDGDDGEFDTSKAIVTGRALIVRGPEPSEIMLFCAVLEISLRQRESIGLSGHERDVLDDACASICIGNFYVIMTGREALEVKPLV
jgi:hypothetical protein